MSDAECLRAGPRDSSFGIRHSLVIRHSSFALAALALVLSLVAGCSRTPPPSASGKLDVFVSIVPQKYFVDRIGDGYVNCTVMVQPGQDPHSYEPTPKQMAALSNASLYFRVGMPFEGAWIPRVQSANAKLKVVDTRAGIKLLDMSAEEKREHADDPEGKDPHTWLSPRLARVQAKTVCDALVAIDPAHKAQYEANRAALDADLDRLDAELKAALVNLRVRKFIVYHPAWAYFAKEYGLEEVPIEVEGKEPSAKQLAAIVDEAKKDAIRVIFASPQFSRRAAEALASQIGAQVVPLDDLAYDYIDNMKKIAEAIRKASQ
jgi:zinc transport system substrate-binding protein